MAKRADHGAFEDSPPDLPACIAELEVILGEPLPAYRRHSGHRAACIKKTIECLQRRQNHLERMD